MNRREFFETGMALAGGAAIGNVHAAPQAPESRARIRAPLILSHSAPGG